MSHIKGSMKFAHQKLLDRLMRMPNVLVILEDEYLTSQVCSRCSTRSLDFVEVVQLDRCKCGENHHVEPQKKKKGGTKVQSIAEALEKAAQNRIHSIPEFVRTTQPWALKCCYKDDCLVKLWNRDVNAAINMLKLGRYRLESMMAGRTCLPRIPTFTRPSQVNPAA
jgi:hypothetical protein